MALALHLAEDAFALQFLFQDAKRLFDVVVTDENLQGLNSFGNRDVRRQKRALAGPARAPSSRFCSSFNGRRQTIRS
jgi:hypothetical protein